MKTELKHSDLFEIRTIYALTFREIALILGFGINIWRNYEKSIKVFNKISRSNAMIIKLICDPKTFLKLLDELPQITVDKIGVYRFKAIRERTRSVNEYVEDKLNNYKQKMIDKLELLK